MLVPSVPKGVRTPSAGSTEKLSALSAEKYACQGCRCWRGAWSGVRGRSTLVDGAKSSRRNPIPRVWPLPDPPSALRGALCSCVRITATCPVESKTGVRRPVLRDRSRPAASGSPRASSTRSGARSSQGRAPRVPQAWTNLCTVRCEGVSVSLPSRPPPALVTHLEGSVPEVPVA